MFKKVICLYVKYAEYIKTAKHMYSKCCRTVLEWFIDTLASYIFLLSLLKREIAKAEKSKTSYSEETGIMYLCYVIFFFISCVIFPRGGTHKVPVALGCDSVGKGQQEKLKAGTCIPAHRAGHLKFEKKHWLSFGFVQRLLNCSQIISSLKFLPQDEYL